MAKIYCKYHPGTPARWACRHCQINFCNDCIPEGQGDVPECPVCKRPAESLGAGNLIRPFWHRIPSFFLYPLHTAPLLFILALTGIDILISETLFGILIELALFMGLMKYAYVVLEHTARGYLEPPLLNWETISTELELPFKQLFVVLLLIMLNSRLYELGGGGMLMVGILFTALIFPASVMVLAVEHSFFQAINPFTLLGVIRRIGGAYFILCVFLFLLMSGVLEASAFMAQWLPAAIYLPISNFLAMAFLLIMFNMMGYVLYQYHEALGFDIEQEYAEADSVQPEAEETDPAMREVEILIHEGKIEDARDRLIELVKANPGEMRYRERLHRVLIGTGDVDGLRAYSADYISRLMLEGRPSEALRIYSECYRIDKEFKFGNARQRHEMARLLRKNGQARAALAVLNNLHRDFPAYEGIPDAYLLVARLLCENFNQDAKARQVLEFLEKKYPDDPRMAQVQEYRKMVTTLGAS
jgi:hypothetical protein